MSWKLVIRPKAQEDFNRLDHSQKMLVLKRLSKVKENPLPQREGGYGVELGNRNGIDLSDCLKIKLKKAGIRIIYKIERTETTMSVIVIGMRADLAVYREAAKRLGRRRHGAF